MVKCTCYIIAGFILLSCHLHGQDKITYTHDKGTSEKTIHFGNTSKALIPGQTFSISPVGKLVVFMTWTHGEENPVEIFNSSGEKIKAGSVTALDMIAIADDGRIATYGPKPVWDGIAFPSYLCFHDSSLQKRTCLDETFGLNRSGIFTQSGEFVLRIAIDSVMSNSTVGYQLLVFNPEFNLLNEFYLGEINLREERIGVPEIDETLKQIFVRKEVLGKPAKKVGQEFVPAKVKKVILFVFDFTGTLIRKEQH